MSSGAGLNRLGQNGGEILLGALSTTTTAVAAPMAGYGTIGVNDSGAQMWEGIGFTKWAFQLQQVGTVTPTGFQVTVYATLDPLLRANGLYPAKGSTIISPYSWNPLPGPSEQAGTGLISNPMTTSNPWFYSSVPIVAVRVVLTTVGTAGMINVLGFAVP